MTLPVSFSAHDPQISRSLRHYFQLDLIGNVLPYSLFQGLSREYTCRVGKSVGTVPIFTGELVEISTLVPISIISNSSVRHCPSIPIDRGITYQ